MQMAYLWGILGLLALWLVSGVLTRSVNPFAMARGHGGGISLSLLQNLLFTAVAVFAYVTIYAARVVAGVPPDQAPVSNVPENLLIMMGLAVVTAAASKGITVSYLKDGEIPTRDNSGIASDRDGRTDLTKVQMLIWTLVAVGIYLVTFIRQMGALCPSPGPGCATIAMPDLDGTLLVLMGVSQGGYVAGKLVSRTSNIPAIEHVLPNKAKLGEAVTIHGQYLGDSALGNAIILREPDTGQEHPIAATDISSWSDMAIQFRLSPGAPAGTYRLLVRANGLTSNPSELELTA